MRNAYKHSLLNTPHQPKILFLTPTSFCAVHCSFGKVTLSCIFGSVYHRIILNVRWVCQPGAFVPRCFHECDGLPTKCSLQELDGLSLDVLYIKCYYSIYIKEDILTLNLKQFSPSLLLVRCLLRKTRTLGTLIEQKQWRAAWIPRNETSKQKVLTHWIYVC